MKMNKKKSIGLFAATIILATGTATLVNADSHTYYQCLPLEMENDGVIASKQIDMDLQRYINNLCNRYDIPVEIVYAIMWRESMYTADINNKGTNKDGSIDYGLMQINNSNFEWLQERTGLEISEKTILYTYTNVTCGIEIFRINMEYFRQKGYSGDNLLYIALMGYGEGIGKTEQMLMNGITREETTDKGWKMYKYILENQDKLIKE